MLRLLAISDSHGHQPSIEALIQLEAHNEYDAILAAGDIGAPGKKYLKTKEVIAKLSAFSCPVLYVLGDSDPLRKDYDETWSQNGVLLTEEPTFIKDYAVLGLNSISGISFLTSKDDHSYTCEKFKLLYDSTKKHQLEPQKTILVTHERMYNLDEIYREETPIAYFFGHHHYPRHTTYKKTNYVNCSVLDIERNRWRAGNYWIIEIENGKVVATPKPISRPSKVGYLSGGLNKRRQQAKMFNQLFPDLAIPDPVDPPCYTPMDPENYQPGEREAYGF